MRELPDADLIQARGQIVGDEKLLEPAVRGNYRVRDSLLRRQRETRPVRFGNRAGKSLKRFIKRARLRVIDDLMVDLPRNPPEHDLRKDDPRLRSLAHERDRLLDVRRQSAQPRQPVLIILDRLEAQSVGQLVRGLNSTALVEWNQIPAVLVPFDVFFVIPNEQVIIQPVGQRQRLAIHCLELGENHQVVSVALTDGIEAAIFPAIVPPAISQGGCPGGILLHPVVPFRRE